MQKREKIINQRRYQLILPPPTQAMGLCTRTMALLGPLLGGIAGVAADEKGWSKLAESLQQLDPVKTNQLLMDAAFTSLLYYSETRISDEKSFNAHFDQYRADMYPVCVWALWESVHDFFPDFTGYIQKLQTVVGSQFPPAGK